MENKYRSKIDETVAYYDNNASAFIESTINAEVSSLYEDFEKLINPGCKILDLGCGSGRDSRYFVRHGYNVVAVDPSPVMCAHTRTIVDILVYYLLNKWTKYIRHGIMNADNSGGQYHGKKCIIYRTYKS